MADPRERTEREFQLDINQAVANTESEIFGDAMGDDALENDADTSLEEMGEGLEGDDLEDEDEAGEESEGEEGDEAEEGSEDEESDEAEAAEAEAGEGGEAEPVRDERGRFDRQQPQDQRRGVPPGRLREEASARRAAEERNVALERQLAEMNGRMTELSARVNAPSEKKTEQQTAKPDMFSDPEGHERWLIAEAERKAEEKINQRFGAFQQEQQQRVEERVNRNLAEAARGDRAFEFGPAYNALISLDRKSPANQALARRIMDAADPAKELFDWWDENGGPEYREQVLSQLDRRQDTRNSRRQSQTQPRHETRIPNSLRRQPQSLNSIRGGQRQQITDPEMLDDSDESVFSFATRRA